MWTLFLAEFPWFPHNLTKRQFLDNTPLAHPKILQAMTGLWLDLLKKNVNYMCCSLQQSCSRDPRDPSLTVALQSIWSALDPLVSRVRGLRMFEISRWKSARKASRQGNGLQRLRMPQVGFQTRATELANAFPCFSCRRPARGTKSKSGRGNFTAPCSLSHFD